MSALRDLRTALSYFTIVPVGRASAPDAAAVAWLPFVGLGLGAVAGSLGYAAASAGTAAVDRGRTSPLGAAVAFAVIVVGSGALHVDGFLDCCDAVFAPVGAERRREILKDPHHGSFAIAGYATIAALTLAALAAIPPRRYPVALATACALGRLSAARAFVSEPDRDETAPLDRAAVRRTRCVVRMSAISIAGVAALRRRNGLAAVTASLVGGEVCLRSMRRAFGGALPGDGYGFTIVVCETTALLAFALER